MLVRPHHNFLTFKVISLFQSTPEIGVCTHSQKTNETTNEKSCKVLCQKISKHLTLSNNGTAIKLYMQ